MTPSIIQPGNAGALKISGTLDIYAAGALREALAACVEHQDSLKLDLSEVDGCDVAALQLLCSARKSAEASSESFIVTTISPAVAETCQSLGLAPEHLKGTTE